VKKARSLNEQNRIDRDDRQEKEHEPIGKGSYTQRLVPVIQSSDRSGWNGSWSVGVAEIVEPWTTDPPQRGDESTGETGVRRGRPEGKEGESV